MTNFEKQKNYQNEPRFNEVFSRDNLPDKKKRWGTCNISWDYADIRTHWIALYALDNNAVYFDTYKQIFIE